MKIYEVMRQREPRLLSAQRRHHLRRRADAAEVPVAGNGTWRNLVTEEKSKVAETLEEFRGNYRYNLLDANVRRFNAEVMQLWQWDDHEVTNNWSGSKDLSADKRYIEKNVPLLIARGTRAFLENAPMRWYAQEEDERVYRKIA